MAKNNFISTGKRFFLSILAIALTVFLLFSSTAFATDTQSQPEATTEQSTPNWLEPRPLSIVDLVSGGLDPQLLAGSPIVWQPAFGMLQYTSGSKSGDEVTINAKMLPTFLSYAYCLGQEGVRDHWPIVVPASTAKITSNGIDITNQVDRIQYFPAGWEIPNRDSTDGPPRYPESSYPVSFSGGRLELPANMGCKIYFKNGAANGGNIELEFVHNIPTQIAVSIVNSTDVEFKSYYWDEDAQAFGHLESLNNEMLQFKGLAGTGKGRHDYVKFVPSSEANYIVMGFPPVTVDMYAPRNLLQQHKRFEGSGIYRLRETGEPFTDASVGWITMAGIPLNFHSVTPRFSTDKVYLDTFKELKDYRFHALEIVALDNEYNDCMTDGGCSDAYLDSISKTRMDVQIHQLKVTRIAPGLTQIPLCAVGPEWTPADAGTKCSTYRVSSRSGDQNSFASPEVTTANIDGIDLPGTVAAQSSPLTIDMDTVIFLPYITRPAEPEPDNPTADCPCGWFADDGRMLGYVEPPGSR